MNDRAVDVQVAQVDLSAVLPLRHAVLRPGRPLADAAFDGDEAPGTTHHAATLGGEVVAVASVMRADCPAPARAGRWQLRGMAVEPSLHRTGVGQALLRHVHASVAAPMWCNARAGAVPFYAANGWRAVLPAFDVPGIGPHRRMTWSPGPTVLAAGRFLELGHIGGWEFVRRRGVTGVVVIAALTPDGALILVEQWRPPVGASVIELPAGLAGDLADAPDEPLEAAAARELEEETGWTPGSLERVLTGPTSAGAAAEVATLFVARDLRRVGAGGGDGSEAITVHEVPIAEVPTWLRAREAEGALVDPKVLAALWLLERPGR